ncbi:hypothetical protein LB521_04550 [Mesorhizobium sp. BR-1-1-8]|uniref:hypothetical protein n=1 Tax=Mesorhizobium sp. BR-1-1-8 TaxID=2876659 RepID=UPI001CCEA71F|nr:hypothetical protein [Mesorhizobium sp. BR-1-1-8]MBZ9980417.1 hypothetical protein [Mesorhizobium sp. BR-1-1-8]
MALIRLDDGDYLNSENVVKFRRLRGDSYKFLDVSGGEHIGTTYEPDVKFFQVIPAAAGYTAIYVEDDGTLSSRVVVAWRICPGGNYAVVEGSDTDEYGYSAICQPGGSVIDTEGNPFKDLASYKAAASSEREVADAA